MKIMDVKTDLIKQVFHSMEYGKNVNNKEGAYVSFTLQNMKTSLYLFIFRNGTRTKGM